MSDADEAGEALAKWLAPHMAKALAALHAATYDPETCALYVRELGQGVLNRATEFFGVLGHSGRVGSLDLAQRIGTSTPKYIPANLTNSLKQRAAALGLPRPWDETKDIDNRTVWLDRDGIAERMLVALRHEQARRASPGT